MALTQSSLRQCHRRSRAVQNTYPLLVADTFRRTLLRAVAAHRSEEAFGWLLAIVADGRVAVALEVVEALALYKHNAKLAARLEGAVEQRAEHELLERFAELWRSGA